MFKKKLFSILALTILTALRVSAARQPSFYYQWQKLSDDKLLAMGNDFINRNAAPDSALACFTIVANRHDDKSTAADRETGPEGTSASGMSISFPSSTTTKPTRVSATPRSCREATMTGWCAFCSISGACTRPSPSRPRTPRRVSRPSTITSAASIWQ